MTGGLCVTWAVCFVLFCNNIWFIIRSWILVWTLEMWNNKKGRTGTGNYERKNKKYALKKALKGCTYGDVNDKRYVKELISDLLSKEYGVDETNISKAIPFDVPSLLTAQDKFDIIIYMYKKEFGYEALTELIKRYNLATLKYLQGYLWKRKISIII